MKTIASALVVLSVLAGAVASAVTPAAAYGGSYIQQLDQQGRGGHNG